MTVDFAPAPPKQPGVVLWLKVYVVLNALMYLAVAGLLVAVAVFAPDTFADELGPAVILLAIAGFCALLAVGLRPGPDMPRVYRVPDVTVLDRTADLLDQAGGEELVRDELKREHA